MKSTCLVLMLALSMHLLGQQSTSFSKADYLRKSKTQKTVAWVLIGGGLGLASTGIIVAVAQAAKVVAEIPWGTVQPSKNYNTGSALVITGGVLIAASIPFFIVASKNKRRAMSMSFKNEMVPQILKTGIANTPVPSLSLKINL